MMRNITHVLASLATSRVDASASDIQAAIGMIGRHQERVRSGLFASGPALQKVALRLGGHAPEADVWFSGVRLQAEWCGFLNAFMLRSAGDHSHAAVVVPAAAAVAELEGASEEQLAEAVLVGLEIAERIVEGLGDRHQSRGWDVIGTAGAIASSAVAARLLGLDVDRAEQAMGLGGTQLAGLRVQDATDAPSLHCAKAVLNGIEAARLVCQGLDGPRRILEGRRGIFAVACDDAIIDD